MIKVQRKYAVSKARVRLKLGKIPSITVIVQYGTETFLGTYCNILLIFDML